MTNFHFDTFANEISNTLLSADYNNENFVIAITGPWGCGKTTLLNIILDKVNNNKNWLTVNYNAWLNRDTEDVWRSFFVSILCCLRDEFEQNYKLCPDQSTRGTVGDALERLLNNCESALYKSFTVETPGELALDFKELTKTGAKIALKMIPFGNSVSEIAKLFSSNVEEVNSDDIDAAWNILKRNTIKENFEKIEALQQFRSTLQILLSKFLSKNKKLVVAIDDVDRCLPEQALEILEATKLFFDLSDVVFIVAMDNRIIQQGLDIRYSSINKDQVFITAEEYTEKLINLSFNIPPPSEVDFIEYVSQLDSKNEVLLKYIEKSEKILGRSPRKWKRFSEQLNLRINIYEKILSTEKKLFLNDSFFETVIEMELCWFAWPRIMRNFKDFEDYFNFVKEINLCKGKVSTWNPSDDIELIKTLKSETTNIDYLLENLENSDLNINFVRFTSTISIKEVESHKSTFYKIYNMSKQ